MGMYIRWLIYFIPNLFFYIVGMVFAPLIACFITKSERTDRVKRLDNQQVTMMREYLITPLYWFQTHDNAVDEYWWWMFTESSFFHFVKNATQADYDSSATLRWFIRVLWLWRNCAYGFSYNLFGKDLADNDPIAVVEVGNEDSGYWYKFTKRANSFQYKAHIPFCPWLQLDINIGWKTHRGFPRAMYASRVFAIRER